MTEVRTYFISRYALTAGIKKAAGEARRDDPNWIWPHGYSGSMKLGRDIHTTYEAAVAAAQAARTKKIASLRKQIAALEALSF